MTKQRSAPLKLGERHRVTIEKVAHGGHFIARHEGHVLFVRHAIPGEIVDVEITEVAARFVRADAVSVIAPSVDRVAAPCDYARPAGCGGCDFQHIASARQRGLKGEVIREQFRQLAKIAVEVEVEEVGSQLHWRTRATLSSDATGAIGFYAPRSHRVVPITDCLIMAQEMNFPEMALRTWPVQSRIELAISSTGERTIAIAGKEVGAKARISEGPKISHEVVGPTQLEVSQTSFWQSHLQAPQLLSTLVGEEIQLGDRVLDLYGGVGLFTAAVLEIVGSSGEVDLIESSPSATRDAVRNFANHPNVHIHTGDVAAKLPAISQASVAILDPPREGAGKLVLTQLATLQPRSIIYVACDPAALARDTAYLETLGYALSRLRAFDLFPMTHHVECVAYFHPSQRPKTNVS